uniref:Uncharacterized protein n=1 Tax=Inoviridae sp. ctO6A5 TaxID=2826760 RepID=A0A8S5M4T4_9VIRU|nr:MAG TPA: hypothetical protein [Inoviridae sp. ctO6A5]
MTDSALIREPAHSIKITVSRGFLTSWLRNPAQR